ncbi:MAG: hypothetical protein A2Z98_15270 [Spirochaetes bacterium GWB1_27_13]|nr:MAG: hypothetical protein A2Z98_15270 [Spirochaetes bacterium GWB1_27_13]
MIYLYHLVFMQYNGKNSLFLLIFLFSVTFSFGIGITPYIFIIEFEENTTDIVPNMIYYKDCSLDKIEPEVRYDKNYIKLKKLNYPKEIDIEQTNLIDDLEDNKNHDLIHTKQIENTLNKPIPKKINFKIESNFFYNNFYYSTSNFEIFNKNVYERLFLQTDNNKINLNNIFKLNTTYNFNFENKIDFNYGKIYKEIYSNFIFTENLKNINFSEDIAFGYDIKNNFIKSGIFFLVEIKKQFVPQFLFYYNGLDFFIGGGFSYKNNFLETKINNDIQLDFVKNYKFNFDFYINFNYSSIFSLSLIKTDDRFKGENFYKYKKIIDDKEEKNILSLSGIDFKFNKNIVFFNILTIFYFDYYFLSIDLIRNIVFNKPNIFCKFELAFDLKYFLLNFSSDINLSDLKTIDTRFLLEFRDIKTNFITFNAGLASYLKNNFDTIEITSNIKIDFNITKNGLLYTRFNGGLALNNLKSNISAQFIYFIEGGFKAFF